MAAEVIAFKKAFDAEYFIAAYVKRTHGIQYDLFMYIDALQLFEETTKKKQTNDRHLVIDILVVRNSYKRHEISGVRYSRVCDNPADGSTKLKHNGVLNEIFRVVVTLRVAER